MGSCQLIKENGEKCNSANMLNPFYFRDGEGWIKKEIEICQSHKQNVFGGMKQEDEKTRLESNKLQAKRNLIQKYLVGDKDVTYSMLKKNGVKALKKDDLRSEFFETINRITELNTERNEIRDRVCRICKHKLMCDCSQCKDSVYGRQKGEIFSSIMTYGYHGVRGEFYPMHVLCGRIFIQRFGIKLLPSKEKQMTLEQTVT